MPTILAAVGRGAINRTDDVRLVQELLNAHLQPPQRPLPVDGVVGSRMLAVIEDFQRRVVKMTSPDGRVDPGGPTFAALTADASRSLAP
ncbi:MAG: peptidoglycan-binding protein [Candidatus Tectimicrobiota bacterium]